MIDSADPKLAAILREVRALSYEQIGQLLTAILIIHHEHPFAALLRSGLPPDMQATIDQAIMVHAVSRGKTKPAS